MMKAPCSRARGGADVRAALLRIRLHLAQEQRRQSVAFRWESLPWQSRRNFAPPDAAPAQLRLQSVRRDIRAALPVRPVGQEMRFPHWAASAQDPQCDIDVHLAPMGW